MNNKPKRRKKKDNPYTLENSNNILKISFVDSKGVKQGVEVSKEVYDEFNKSELHDLKELNEYDRHIEHLDHTDESLYLNTKNKYRSLEEIVLEKIKYQELYNLIEKLPEIQKRRLKRYYFDNMTLDSIAKIEGCSARAIKYSIDIAVKNLMENFKIRLQK